MVFILFHHKLCVSYTQNYHIAYIWHQNKSKKKCSPYCIKLFCAWEMVIFTGNWTTGLTDNIQFDICPILCCSSSTPTPRIWSPAAYGRVHASPQPTDVPRGKPGVSPRALLITLLWRMKENNCPQTNSK